MIRAKIVLYLISFNKQTTEYEILSEQPNLYKECGEYIRSNATNIDDEINRIYSKYLDLNYEYLRFISIKPYIRDAEIILPFYSIIPYNSYDIKNSYKISANHYAHSIPDIRQILNIM